jgi:hypothetical protein
MNELERREALEQALSGDLKEWAGLPAGCTAEDFAALAGGDGAPPAERQGWLAGMQVTLWDYGGFPGPLRVFADDAGHAFLVWADWPPGGGEGARAIAALGPAEAVLIDAPSRRPGTVQHVWGARGVAAYVAHDGSVRGLALFMPASPELYLTALGGNEGPPYRPRPATPVDAALPGLE